jgi:CheY-like chemotaxis protein
MIVEQIRDQPVRDHLDRTNDVLNNFDVALGNVSSDISKAGLEISRLLGAFFVLRVQGPGLETTLLDITLQQLCENLDDLQTGENKIIADNDHTEADIRNLSISLTIRTPNDVDNIGQFDLEIMLVEPNKMVAKLVSQKLRACGYRVTILRGSIDSLTYTLVSKPDMIIASADSGKMSSIDLACAIGAMPHAQKFPFALLTSRDRDHTALSELTQASAVIKKGSKFSDDLADAFPQFDLL